MLLFLLQVCLPYAHLAGHACSHPYDASPSDQECTMLAGAIQKPAHQAGLCPICRLIPQHGGAYVPVSGVAWTVAIRPAPLPCAAEPAILTILDFSPESSRGPPA